jgi:penicillin G amidase
MAKFWRRALLGLFAFVGLSTSALWFYARSSLPKLDGEMTVAGVQARVTIIRDVNGVPHIQAQNWNDAAFGLGFAHAQDRLWQLDFNRRIGQGRLAEILGKPALETDMFLRTLGFYRLAQADYTTLSADAKSYVDAYTAGINAFLDTRRGALPPEFLLTGAKMAPWQPADSLVWLKLMSLDLSYQWRTELTRLQFLTRMSPQKLAQILPPYPGDAPFLLPDLATLLPGLPKAANAGGLAAAPEGKGSNNWVAGSRTKSGKPLLANDPHLSLTTPSIWYMAHLNVGNQSVVGASLPSLPFIVLGRTNRLAWGFTNTGPDVQDLIVERITDAKTGVYARADGAARLATRQEVFAIKGEAAQTLTIRSSSNGPLISDVLPKVKALLGERYALALRWTALEPGDTTMRAGVRLMQATDTTSFLTALRDYLSPQQNIVYADVDGNIGYIAPGRVPIRKPQNRTQGLMPTPGWTGEADWVGTIPFEGLPSLVNPAQGYIATANQKIVDASYPFYLTRDWAAPDRFARIRQMIEATPKHDLDSMAAIQSDVLAPSILPLRNAMLAQAAPFAPEDQAMLTAFQRWDGLMAGNRWEPALFHAWNMALIKRLTQDDLGPLYQDNQRLRQPFLLAVLGPASKQSDWCDDRRTRPIETCQQQTQAALREAVSTMAGLQKTPEWQKWRWDRVRIVVNAHRPFEQVPFLARFFSIHSPYEGSDNTINVAHMIMKGKNPYRAEHLASYRALYDLSNLEQSRYVIPTGQSGNFFSPYYRDLSKLWGANRYITIPTRPEAIAKSATNKLILQPPLPPAKF